MRTVLRAAALVGLASLPAGCVDETPHAHTASTTIPPDGGPQPKAATYTCGDGSALTVENRSSEVVLTMAAGDPVTLPAAPENQRSRYGAEGYALVLDGSEALYMKGGKTPLNCRR